MKASIRKNKLKKGTSYTVLIDYGTVNGIRKRENLETFPTKKEAENYQSKIQTEINNNTFINVPDISFSEAIDEWMDNYVQNECEPNTADSYNTINKKYLKPHLGHIPFKIISSPQGIDIINDYYKYLRFELEGKIDPTTNTILKNLSYSSVKHHKAQISGIFTYFMKNKKIGNNICLNTIIPKDDSEKSKDLVINDVEDFEDEELLEDEEALTPEQAIMILNLFMNTFMMLPVAFAMFLGLRRSETCGILKSKVDKENNRIIINATRVRCGNKTIYKKRNKNKTSRRILYYPKILKQIMELDEKRQELNKSILGEKYIDSKFLCVKDNGEPLSLSYISKKFKNEFDKFIKREKEKAEKNNQEFNFPYVTYHKLRHLNITALLESGAELVDVQKNAGHSDIKTTIGYTHQYTKNKIQVAEKTDEIFSPYIKII